MNDQDKRAVESMARCGIDFDGLCKAFSGFPIEEIERVYMKVRKLGTSDSGEQDIKCCGSDAR